MARFFPLKSLPGIALGGLICAAGLFASLQAQTMVQEQPNAAPASGPAAAPAKPAPAAVANNAPAKPATAPMTNAAPVNPPDPMQRYGPILGASDEVLHPLKLKMPVPNIGEVHIPRPQESDMRDKLEALASLSDTDIRLQLEQWPAYSKMSLRDQGMMLQRIQDFRDYRYHIAMMKAHDMGLLTLTPDQKQQFEKEYWAKRLQMDRDIAKQVQPIVAQHEQKLQDELFREFSQASPGPLAKASPGNKPGSPPAPNKPGTPMPPANKPATAADKPAPTTVASSPATNSVQPMQPQSIPMSAASQ